MNHTGTACRSSVHRMLTWSEVRDLLSVVGAQDVDELIAMLQVYLDG